MHLLVNIRAVLLDSLLELELFGLGKEGVVGTLSFGSSASENIGLLFFIID